MVNMPLSSMTPTKRVVLSEIARLFDPLGWLAPVIELPKLSMQDLWLLKLEWDTPLKREILSHWIDFRNSLSILPKLIIRHFAQIKEDEPWSLHGFCDTSKRAYAAVLYALSTDGKTTILMVKSKVVPLKV